MIINRLAVRVTLSASSLHLTCLEVLDIGFWYTGFWYTGRVLSIQEYMSWFTAPPKVCEVCLPQGGENSWDVLILLTISGYNSSYLQSRLHSYKTMACVKSSYFINIILSYILAITTVPYYSTTKLQCQSQYYH